MVANRLEQQPTLRLLRRPTRQTEVLTFPTTSAPEPETIPRPDRTRPVERYKTPSAFSFFDSYEHYAHWRQLYDLEEAANRIRWKLLGDLASLRNEGIGAQWTHDIVTEVVWTQGAIRFRNLQYKQGDDMIEMYRQSLLQLSPDVEPELRARYELEIAQTIAIWEACVAPLKRLHHGSVSELSEHLLDQGFALAELPLTLGLKATLPDLATYPNATIKVLLGPPVVSVSPPSPIHRQGESSFGWSSRLVFIPELGKAAILQNGTFTAYSQREISHFLRFKNLDRPNLSTEAQLMAYLNLLPPKFTAQHSLSILNQIIEEIGYFKALPPIDKHIRPGEFSHQQHVEAMLEIFEFEYQQLLKHPELEVSLNQRFQHWETAIMHNAIAGFDDFDQAHFVAAYKALYSQTEIAQKPDDFLKATKSLISSAYPSIAKVVDFSKLDCVSGMFTRLNSTFKLQGFDQLLSLPATKLLKQAEQQGLMSEAELDHFCKTFNLPRKLFARNKEHRLCPGCVANGNTEPPAFIGPCVCAVCHAKDNLGLKVAPDLAPEVPKKSAAPAKNESEPLRIYKKSVSLTEMLNGDIYEHFLPQDINGIIEQWPKSANFRQLVRNAPQEQLLAA